MMTTATNSRVGRIFGRAHEIWSELDYAQRRLLEIQTGVPVTATTTKPGSTAAVGRFRPGWKEE